MELKTYDVEVEIRHLTLYDGYKDIMAVEVQVENIEDIVREVLNILCLSDNEIWWEMRWEEHVETEVILYQDQYGI